MFNLMINHTRKNTNTKTNQNFYLLWLILQNVSMERLGLEKSSIFTQIQRIFSTCQNVTEDEFDVDEFVQYIMHI